ncbi:alpha/beta fold hydrolase [uncultured Gilliamella sp.]|jgi:Predicted hydrolases or acyltransferases (alpha/beta hydrolase superfamily)|uniref:alpha/beta fold hydrolase n=1 Tax=uncultured Gilliamella sp. TaxID=1193505 RepID=UPI0025FB802A|nr:alpha/beta fold hydrolase [uncultured Gilliamella sp.]
MKLNYKLQGNGPAIIFMHGVFGSLDNLNMLAKNLLSNYQIVQVDMRNHGFSPWSDVMNYQVMAEDIAQLCHNLGLQDVILIGHSMGGKVALQLTQIIPDIIQQIVAIDIAPIQYPIATNALVLNALTQVVSQSITDKKQIISIMKNNELTDATIQFLLKSFKNGQWLFNVDVIVKQYQHLCDWQMISPWLKPTLFIKGGNSNYITAKDYDEIYLQFPNAKIETVIGAGHNVHAEKTAQVLQILQHWLCHQS